MWRCCEFGSHSWQGVLKTTLCDKVCQWLAAGLWFSPVSSTNKTDSHDITEIMLKVAWNTITLTLFHHTLTKDQVEVWLSIIPQLLRINTLSERVIVVQLEASNFSVFSQKDVIFRCDDVHILRWIFIVLAHWNNSPQVDMSINSDTLCPLLNGRVLSGVAANTNSIPRERENISQSLELYIQQSTLSKSFVFVPAGKVVNNVVLWRKYYFHIEKWDRNCLPFRSTWVHPRFLVGFVLLDLLFYMYAFCPFVLFLLAIVLSVLLQYTDSDYPFWYLQTLLKIGLEYKTCKNLLLRNYKLY